MKKLKLGFAITASFCTFEKTFEIMRSLSSTYEIVPIMSFNAANIDTRFGKAYEHLKRAEDICGREVIRNIENAEPIGPREMTDIMLVLPCTGNTLAKLAHSITDTPVTMAVKSHLRNEKPVVIALSTNDALAGTAKNFGILLNAKNFFFVPVFQDDYMKKPTSLTADLNLTDETLKLALANMRIKF